MPNPTPQSIVEKLSEAQRRLILADEWRYLRAIETGRQPGNLLPAERRVAKNLIAKGIMEFEVGYLPSYDVYKFTPLGLQVRAILQEQAK